MRAEMRASHEAAPGTDTPAMYRSSLRVLIIDGHPAVDQVFKALVNSIRD